MEKTRIIRSGKEVELLKYVPDYYLIAERVNRILDQLLEMLYFYMLNFTIAHEFAHIAHGHLKENSCNNYIDEIFELDEEEKSRNWATQLKEYDADSLAVMIQSLLFVQQWEDDIYANLSRFDNMFLANYLCFRIFADKAGRSFRDYMEKDIVEYDHPHPGIRMYYAYILYIFCIHTGLEHGRVTPKM